MIFIVLKIVCVFFSLMLLLLTLEIYLEFQNYADNKYLPLKYGVKKNVDYILSANNIELSRRVKEYTWILQKEDKSDGVVEAEKANDERHNKDKLRSDLFDGTINLQRDEIEETVEVLVPIKNVSVNLSKAFINDVNVTTTERSTIKINAIRTDNIENMNHSDLIDCPPEPPDLVGDIVANKIIVDTEEIEEKFGSVLLDGGTYIPPCKVREWVAIIVPFRNASEQLSIFLNNMHPFLIKQQIQYTIYVVEQTESKLYNKGALLNVAAITALKERNFDCFIFHDIDLLPENDFNLYTCPEFPRHMSVAVDVYKYKLPSEKLVNGVYGILTSQFKVLNGYSNSFSEWGVDADMYNRIKYHGYDVLRHPPSLGRYTMLKHKKENYAKDVESFLTRSIKYAHIDGLNSLNYDIQSKHQFPLYTKFLVNVRDF